MAIALRAAGAWVFGINSLTPAIPAAQLTGDMMLLVASGKPFDLGWSVSTSGWSALTRGQSGTTAAGVDTGSMALQVWWKVATSDTETDPTVTEGSPTFNVAGAVVYVLSKGAGENWATPVVVYGADETTGTAISVTFASDPGGLSGDYVVLACGINTDSMGPLTTDLTPSWTGITFGTADAGIEGESTSGGDMSGHVMSSPVSSGTSSAAPTATGTGTATGGADRLEACFIRLRLAAAQTLTPSPAVSAFAVNTPTVQRGPLTIIPSAVSEAAFAVNIPALLKGPVVRLPNAVVSAFAVNTPVVVSGQTASPSAVAAVLSVVAPTVQRGPTTLLPGAASSAFAVNVPTLIKGPLTLIPTPVLGIFVVAVPVMGGQGTVRYEGIGWIDWGGRHGLGL